MKILVDLRNNLTAIVMDNQLKRILCLFSFFIALSTMTIAQNSLPMDLDVTDYTVEQKTEINNLLESTRNSLVTKLNRSKDDEYISRVIITNSYKFAKGYSNIMDEDSVPFKLVTGSTSFLGCWVSDNFISTGSCWDTHLYKVNGAKFDSLK